MQAHCSLFPEKQPEPADGSHGPDPARGSCSSAPRTVGLVGVLGLIGAGVSPFGVASPVSPGAKELPWRETEGIWVIFDGIRTP